MEIKDNELHDSQFNLKTVDSSVRLNRSGMEKDKKNYFAIWLAAVVILVILAALTGEQVLISISTEKRILPF